MLMESPKEELSLSVICANLRRRKDRRFYVENKIKSILGQPVEILTAVDGDEVSEARIARYPKGVSTSSFAVRITKLLALRNFLRSGKSHLLFLEDDVALLPEFEETLKRAMKSDGDVVYLGANHVEPPTPGEEWDHCTYVYSNHALLFSREGALKARRMLLEWNFPQSDVEFAENIRSGKLKALCPRKLVAYQRMTKSNNCGHPGDLSLARGLSMDLTGDDVAVLEAALVGCYSAIEWGTGGTSAFISQCLGFFGMLTSVEHNSDWASTTRNLLKTKGVSKYRLLVRPPQSSRPVEMYNRFSVRELSSYINAPGRYVQNGSVDLALVDGRQRIECALASAKWLRKGGKLLIHDFWGRARYRARLHELLELFDYVLESPNLGDRQGFALFTKK